MRFKFLSLQACLLIIMPHIGFTSGISAQNIDKREIIKIGLLVQDAGSVAAKHGAEMAVSSANKKVGVKGVLFSLVVSSMDGPWGTGSREAVKMIFDDSVTAILGSHDGRNAHLVERVTAKSRVPFLSAWSGDPTLTQAFIPWFFNIVPNDVQQAAALEDLIYQRRKLSRIALISGNDYDSKSAASNFVKVLSDQKRPQPLQFPVEDADPDVSEIPDEISRADIEGIVLIVQPPASLKIAEMLKLKHIDVPVFGTTALLNENKISGNDLRMYESFIIVSPGYCSGTGGASFCEDYRKAFGIKPGAVASYAFDGMNLLMEAIRNSGTGYELIRKDLSEIRYEGVTGTISFDGKGNLKGTPGFVEIKNGIPVPLN